MFLHVISQSGDAKHTVQPATLCCTCKRQLYKQQAARPADSIRTAGWKNEQKKREGVAIFVWQHEDNNQSAVQYVQTK